MRKCADVQMREGENVQMWEGENVQMCESLLSGKSLNVKKGGLNLLLKE
jgi:hypothetical protein